MSPLKFSRYATVPLSLKYSGSVVIYFNLKKMKLNFYIEMNTFATLNRFVSINFLKLCRPTSFLLLIFTEKQEKFNSTCKFTHFTVVVKLNIILY